MNSTDELSALIRDLSERNADTKKGRGCSSSELATLLRIYFSRKIRGFLADIVLNIATCPNAAVLGAEDILIEVSGTIRNYAVHAGRKMGDNLQHAIAAKLGHFVLESPVDRFNSLKESEMDVFNVAALRESLKSVWEESNREEDNIDFGDHI
jgi:hypothetical protein